MLGGGVLRFPVREGNFENLWLRSFSMSYAFISAKPGLWVPTIFEAKFDMRRVAVFALHFGQDVSSGLAYVGWINSKTS